MSLGEQIQKFLEEKFKKYNKDQFFTDVGFSRATAGKILNADHRNPEFKTILEIAKYFNCSVDEVIKRKKKYYKKSKNYKFKDISLEEIQLNLKSFINKKLEEKKLKNKKFTPQKLAKELGFNEHMIVHFIKDKKKLESETIAALADYFEVSINEMINFKVTSSNQESQTIRK